MSADEGSVTIRLGPKVSLSFDNCDGIEIKSLKFLLSDKIYDFGLMFSATNDVKLHDIMIGMNDEHSTRCSAIISQASTIRVSDSSFIGIRGHFGAALLALNSESTKNNFLFDRNTANSGGAIAMSGTAKLILNPQSEIIFTENQAQSFGGAVKVCGSS